MIFEEKEDGMLIDIPHREMMIMNTKQFLILILKARHIYQGHFNAELDDDNPKEN